MSGDPSFITSKAPPGGNSDKKLIGICVFIGNTTHQLGRCTKTTWTYLPACLLNSDQRGADRGGIAEIKSSKIQAPITKEISSFKLQAASS